MTPDDLAALLDEHDWTHERTDGRGFRTVGGLSEETDGEGKRKRVVRVQDIRSIGLRAEHADGRALRVLWVQPPGVTPTGRTKAFSLEGAWRGALYRMRCACPPVDETGAKTHAHAGEHAGQVLAAEELSAFVSAADPLAAWKAIQACRAAASLAAQAREESKQECLQCNRMVRTKKNGEPFKHRCS